MEIKGKIIEVLPIRSGVSKTSGKEWKSQDYVIESSDSYPCKCCFRVFGDNRIQNFAIQKGEELTVSFQIDAHEYDGRWFNNINALAITRIYNVHDASENHKEESVRCKDNKAEDDLPF